MRHNFKVVAGVILLCLLPALAGSQTTDLQQTTIGDQHDRTDEKYTLLGTIKDKETGELIIGATVKVDRVDGGTTTDTDGKFLIVMPHGESVLEVSYLGYSDMKIAVTIYSNGFLELSMSAQAIELEQVVIQGQNEASNIESVISGVERLSIQELAESAQLLGEVDVLRSIQALSGVTSTGDGASGFNVRGGNSDENLILQDDALIINPTHTLGFFSLFHPDLISSVQLYKGNQPAYYGGRLSSVLQVDLREGNKEKYEFNGGIGMAASRLTFEGPIKKGKGSFIIGGRASYMNWLLNLVSNINVKESRSLFYDVTIKADYRLSDKTKVGFTTFLTGDDFQFAREVNFDYETRTAAAYINHLVNDKWNLRLSANIGDYTSSLFDIQANDKSRFTNGVQYFRSSLRSFYKVNDRLEFIAGVEADRFTVSPGDLQPENGSSAVVPETLADEKAFALTPFAQIEWNLTDALAINAGIRYTKYTKLGPGQVAIYEDGVQRSQNSLIEVQDFSSGDAIVSFNGFEPRLSINWKVTDESSVKLGFNRGFQYLNQLSNTASATPVDVWKLSDQYTPTQSADNYNLGYFRNFAENKYATSLSVFYKDQNSIVEYRDFPELLLNEFLEREVVSGIGRSYGVEVNAAKRYGNTKFDINYTYSRSERQVVESPTQRSINQGEWFPSNFDKPHSLNASLTQKVGRIANLSVNFTYSTGRPITAPVSNFTIENILNVPIFSERNQFRIPDYHRLDLAYTIGPFGKKDKSENRITLSVYNVYSRKNAYSVFFRQRPFQRLNTIRIATLGSVFPAITYNFKFK